MASLKLGWNLVQNKINYEYIAFESQHNTNCIINALNFSIILS